MTTDLRDMVYGKYKKEYDRVKGRDPMSMVLVTSWSVKKTEKRILRFSNTHESCHKIVTALFITLFDQKKEPFSPS